MYQALYRKWRSRTFDQVVGQGHITETLKRQVDSSRLSHAYLFTGTRGTGKTSCAKLLARAVNCQQPDHGNPCNCCPACVGIENGSILDVMELDAASNNRVDDIRAILDEAVYAPAAVKKRVYIIDEVHTLSAQAFNALLQTLEEPPEHLMFILATTELHKVPATIKSRCQQFAFKRIQSGEIARHLEYVAQQEGFTLTPEGAGLIARLADGGMRDALSLLDQCLAGGGTVDEGRVFSALGLAGNLETAALLDTLADGNGEDALARLARLYDGGKEIAALCGELSTLLRDLLVRKTAPQAGASLMTGGYDEATMSRLAQRFDVPRLVQMLRVVQQTGADLARSSNRRTDMELCLITLATPALDSSAGGLAARVARLEAGGSQASGMPAAAPAPVLQAEGRERERRGQKVTAKVTAPPPAVHQTPPPWAEPPVKAQPAPPAEEVPWEEPPVKAQPAPPGGGGPLGGAAGEGAARSPGGGSPLGGAAPSGSPPVPCGPGRQGGGRSARCAQSGGGRAEDGRSAAPGGTPCAPRPGGDGRLARLGAGAWGAAGNALPRRLQHDVYQRHGRGPLGRHCGDHLGGQ